MKRTKIFALILAICFVLAGLAGCGGDDAGSGSAAPPASAGSDAGSAGSTGGSSTDPAAATPDDEEAANWEGKELKFASIYTAEAAIMGPINEWMDRVNEVTDGKITITLYPTDMLLASTDQFPGVLDGVADMTLTAPAYNADYWPASRAFSLPGLQIDNSTVGAYVATDFIRNSGYEEFNQAKPLWALAIEPWGLMSNVPVTKLEDFKGLDYRCNTFMVPVVEALGAAPNGMPASEIYEGLMKGTVDLTDGGFAALIDWKLSEVTKYAVSIPGLTNTAHYCLMNNDVWASIPKKYQDAIEATIMDELLPALAPVQHEQCLNGLSVGIEAGIESSVIEGEENQRIMDAIMPVTQAWIDDMEAQGQPGQKIWDDLTALVEKYDALYGEN